MNHSDAYNTGYESAILGESKADCPCAAETWEREEWLEGFSTANDCDIRETREPCCDL